MTDVLMTQIAKEYMLRMGITDTQYLLVRHLDQPHPYCHLVYNRVGNNGQTISDKNIKIRNAKVCRALTGKYGLHLAPGKDDVRRERLREPDKTKYEIYDAIKTSLPNCSDGTEALPARTQNQNEIINLKQATMKEDNMMSYEIYEDFKDAMVKTIKTELSAKNSQSTDNELPPRITQHRVIFSSKSPLIFSLVLFLFISCMISSSALYFGTTTASTTT